MNIAQVLEYKLKFDDLVAEMKDAAKGTEAIFLPDVYKRQIHRLHQIYLIMHRTFDLHQ